MDDDICECLVCGRQHKSLNAESLSHNDACRLSRVFNEGNDLRSTQDATINEWLKKLIARTTGQGRQRREMGETDG